MNQTADKNNFVQKLPSDDIHKKDKRHDTESAKNSSVLPQHTELRN